VVATEIEGADRIGITMPDVRERGRAQTAGATTGRRDRQYRLPASEQYRSTKSTSASPQHECLDAANLGLDSRAASPSRSQRFAGKRRSSLSFLRYARPEAGPLALVVDARLEH